MKKTAKNPRTATTTTPVTGHQPKALSEVDGSPATSHPAPITLGEWLALAVILGAGAWLRFSHLGLLEFKGDEAVAAQLALDFVKSGHLPTGGLMSSVGVTNPPLFIYLLIPLFLFTTSVTAVCCAIAALGLGAVVVCWHVGRKYYGPTAGWVAAALFAVSPWAVIYSRKIWAQDLVPVFATGAIWAVHAVVAGRKPKAVFWAMLLPLCVIQIHFSGLALTAVVVAILLAVRPRVDWRWAVAGVVAAGVLALPYVMVQSRNGWAEYRRMAEQRSGRNWQIPPGMIIRPDSGYPLPRRPGEGWQHALAILNAGEIEDVLGLSATPPVDPQGIWAGKGRDYFLPQIEWSGWLLALERALLVGALVWLAAQAALGLRRSNTIPWLRVDSNVTAWILVLWLVIPVLVFLVAGLWTYLSYYAILYPAPFLALGAVAEQTARGGHAPAPSWRRWSVAAAAVVLMAANGWFMMDLYGFLEKNGGAQGTYGTALGYKLAAARWLAGQEDVPRLVADRRLVQIDQLNRPEIAQMDLAFLAVLARERDGDNFGSTNTVVLVVDENRSNFNPRRMPQFATPPQTNFGPMRLYFLSR